MQFLFDKDKCINAKNILGKNSLISTIWRKDFAPSNKIGNCTNLYRILKPNDCCDFYQKYITYGSEHHSLPISKRGLTYDELISLSEKYKEEVESRIDLSYDLSMYFYDAVCHIIVETWDGQQTERDFMEFLNRLGYSCSKFDGSIDSEYGVDIKVTRNDGRVSAIQIKPISFFISNRSDVQSDRINLCRKYEQAFNRFGFKTYYAIYVRDKRTNDITWVKNGNGYRFRINELFEYDPNDIEGSFKRLKLPEVYEKLPL